jgi:hypothetical protein
MIPKALSVAGIKGSPRSEQDIEMWIERKVVK